MSGLNLRIVGLQALKNDLESLKLDTNTEDILDAAGAFLLFRIRTRFLNQEAPDGTTWVESFAAAARREAGEGGKTLFDTGTLFNSISLGRGVKGIRTIFTNVDYAEKHQFGLEGNADRVFLGFNDEDERGVEAVISARIKSAL